MEPDLFRFDDHGRFGAKRTNFFAWTVLIILLMGVALAAWLGSFYVIGQPERPESYRILQKLHKIEPPKRFALTAAPAGEFLNPTKLYKRYQSMGPAELARKDAELTRNFIRNFQQVHGLVTYVVGRFNIMGARELTPDDVFTSGAVALTRSADQPELMMEHVFTTANEHDAKLLQERLAMGMDINLERTHDLSAVVHVERLPDGRIQITAVPLLYGSYAVTRGTGTFSLEPPAELNLAAGWPIFKSDNRQTVETRYQEYRAKIAPATSALPIIGLPPAKTAPPSEDALVRVEPAVPLTEEPSSIPIRPGRKAPPVAGGIFNETAPVAQAAGTPIKALRALPVTAADLSPKASPALAQAPAAPGPTIMRALPVDAPSPACRPYLHHECHLENLRARRSPRRSHPRLRRASRSRRRTASAASACI